MKARKKPVEIECFQYDGDLIDKEGNYCVPNWAVEAYANGVLFYGTYVSGDKELPGALFIKTLEGDMFVNMFDYVIQGVNGELYPCKPDIFDKTYDIVSD